MSPETVYLPDMAVPLANYPHGKKFGSSLFLSGMSARQKDGSVRGVTKNADGTVATDISEQTMGVIENMKAVLEEAGGSLNSLVDVTVFLTNMDDYSLFNKVYNQYFDMKNGPARTTVGVRELPGKHLLIEIKGLAHLS